MYNKFKNQDKGFILMENIISIALISIIIISISFLFCFVLNSYKHYIELWQTEHDADITLKYIEKRLREFNQESIIFYSKENIFKGKNYDNKNMWIDLSGKKPLGNNRLIYFYKSKKEIRVNKNNEHNVLTDNIEDVIINELVEGQLIEIEVITNKSNYSKKIKLNLNYKKE